MNLPPLIDINNVCKSYVIAQHSTPVLKGVDFSVKKGEMVAVLGASGSGKSTLMNIIGLLDCVDSGRYLLKGIDVGNLSEDERAHRRNKTIGFVFQQFNLLPRLSAHYNVVLPLHYCKMDKQTIHAKVHEALGVVDMEGFADRLPSQLSGGQQQRVAIARALVNSPELILADEPTGALDSKTSSEVMALFDRLHQSGRTIILITHDAKIAAACQRQVNMVDGVLHEGALV